MDNTEVFNTCIDRLNQNSQNHEAFDSAIKILTNEHVLSAGKLRKKLSQATDLNINDIKKCESSLKSTPLTHSQITSDFMQTLGEIAPVGVNGNLWAYNEEFGLWKPLALTKVAVNIGKKYETHSRCVKQGDYTAIANLIYDDTFDQVFFTHAPSGIKSPDGFYSVKDNRLVITENCHTNKARFDLNISPQDDCKMTEFMSMLEYAFGDTFEDQVRQLRMCFGLSVMGMLSTVQRACFLIGPGACGKSTILRVLDALFPSEYVAHISPLDLDCDYKKAALADKLLNLVPEIDKAKVVPSADFKSVVGEDEIHARQPYGRVFNFVSYASNWFNGNFYLTTKDHSDGFYRRWAIFKFFHAKPENERDPMLTQRIIENELPGILAWAFDGVNDYLENGLYLSRTHESALTEWKTEGNSVLSWLNDDESGVFIRSTGDKSEPLTRTKAYKKYSCWCFNNNRKPFSKKQFHAFVEESGFCSTKYTGYNCYTGLSCDSTSHDKPSVVRMPF